ncbi:hypothetical protein HYPSUDRAFT_216764 [Hypholoma sublateritium FD-334 SS-4]|uniref:Uncharacterized protein n=1 Tax=Hypholoma sublateritium (strain FD-334 SS-4) TaxID=945553 RepID=A0A0D2L254_HYPSF|nr:hypothetical protein HYPSUDRAFT_216764 [Hypholoma sublateritium FD-334 SS-4]
MRRWSSRRIGPDGAAYLISIADSRRERRPPLLPPSLTLTPPPRAPAPAQRRGLRRPPMGIQRAMFARRTCARHRAQLLQMAALYIAPPRSHCIMALARQNSAAREPLPQPPTHQQPVRTHVIAMRTVRMHDAPPFLRGARINQRPIQMHYGILIRASLIVDCVRFARPLGRPCGRINVSRNIDPMWRTGAASYFHWLSAPRRPVH